MDCTTNKLPFSNRAPTRTHGCPKYLKYVAYLGFFFSGVPVVLFCDNFTLIFDASVVNLPSEARQIELTSIEN